MNEELQLELERLRLEDKERERRHEARRATSELRWRFAYLLVGFLGGGATTAGGVAVLGNGPEDALSPPGQRVEMRYDTSDTGE